MIKVNLLPVKKKKKAAQVPGFVLAALLVTLLSAAVMFYVYYMFTEKVALRKNQVASNDVKIAELEKRILAVTDYEKRNQDYKARKDIIEQLGKNKTLPVKVLDEVSAQLPNGVWVTAMDLKNSGSELSMNCTAFTNTDVVNYVNNLKGSKLFADVYLNESVQSQVAGFSVYTFSIIIKVKT
ncbi:MAG: PilN domain-containing protein [Thermodesulfovibrionales bacterium]